MADITVIVTWEKEDLDAGNIYFRNFFVVCITSKYGFCKCLRKCDKIHYSDICEDHKCDGDKCDKRHPSDC